MRKILLKLADRIRRYFRPTINEALREFGIGEPMPHSKEELEKLKKMLEDYEKQISSK